MRQLKTAPGEPVIVVRGIFRKKYYYILTPGGVYELPQYKWFWNKESKDVETTE